MVAGRIVAGPHVRNSCRRHLDDLEHAHERGLYYDPEAAARSFRFFEGVLKLNGGQFEGRPFILEPSQKFKLGSIFGWKRADGTRRFRRAYIEEGKGNGKSPFAGGIGIYCMVADGEERAEVYAAGKDKAQAMVLFRDSVAMVDQSPALASRIAKSGGNPVWNLSFLKTASFFRPISREGASSGPRPSCALCDEIHEHPDGDTIEMLERGFKFRRQPLLLMITNSGSDRNSICWAEHLNACAVAAGCRKEELDEDFTYVGKVHDDADANFSYVCALDKDDDPLTDPTCWQKANPLFGVILDHDYLAGVVAQARAMPSKLNGILRLHFCVWTDGETAWISRAILESVLADFDPAVEHKGKEIKGAGLDLSGTKDLTAAAFVVETGTKAVQRADGAVVELPTYDAWIEAWTPLDTLDARAKADHAPYRVWVETCYPGTEEPYLNAIEGKRVRFDHVAARIAALAADPTIADLAYDVYAYSKFQETLDDFGVTLNATPHPQGGKRRAKPSEAKVEAAKAADLPAPLGLWMPGSIAMLEELILEGRIRLRRSPVLVSALMGAALATDELMGVSWFSKQKSTLRIDPAVALAMAVGAATDGAPTKIQSFWAVLDPNPPAEAPKTQE